MSVFFFHLTEKKVLKKNLDRNINGLDEFKLAMQIIATIQSTNISTELQLHEIQETFAILADHKIEVMNYPLSLTLFVQLIPILCASRPKIPRSKTFAKVSLYCNCKIKRFMTP